jgi:hypothetical protein
MSLSTTLPLAIAAQPATRRRRLTRQAWRAAIWGYTGAIAAMAAFAGMYVFVGPELIEVHKMGAHVTGLLITVAVVTAFTGRMDRRARRQTLGLVGLLLVQGMLVHLHVVSAWIAALHPANAMVLFWASFTVARGSADALARAEGAAVAVRQPAPAPAMLRPEPA